MTDDGVDLDALDPRTRRWVERLLDAGSVEVRRGRERLGTLAFAPAVLTGEVLPPAGTREAAVPLREDTKVLVTTMLLSGEARERLRQSFGPGWVVVDLHDAPDTADVVLTLPSSPQLMQRWPQMFPGAQIVITEILDAELGIDVAGPVGRMLDAGAHAYLPPRPIEQVAENVQAFLAGRAAAAISAAPPRVAEIASPARASDDAGTPPPLTGQVAGRPADATGPAPARVGGAVRPAAGGAAPYADDHGDGLLHRILPRRLHRRP